MLIKTLQAITNKLATKLWQTRKPIFLTNMILECQLSEIFVTKKRPSSFNNKKLNISDSTLACDFDVWIV